MNVKAMKVLIVAHVKNGRFSPFTAEQGEALAKAGCVVEMFGVEGKGLWGYLRNYPRLKKKLRAFSPDIVHAYYGLSGLLANLQRKYPVVTSFIGSDVHKGGWVLWLSKIAMKLSKFNIFGGQWLKDRSGYNKPNSCIIRFGVDEQRFYPIDKAETLKRVKEDPAMAEKLASFIAEGNKRHPIMFAGAFANTVKNAPLAQAAVDLLKKEGDYELLELKGYTREQVNLLQNFVDCLVVTSFRESGPLVVKEAMASGCPVVSVEVGDVREYIGSLDGCYIVERTPESVADGIRKAVAFGGKTDGSGRLKELDLYNSIIAGKLMDIYSKVLESK